MSKVLFVAFTKKEFIKMLREQINDKDIILYSTGVKEVKTTKKTKNSFIQFQFPHEMLAGADDIRGKNWIRFVVPGVASSPPKPTPKQTLIPPLWKRKGRV